MDKLHQLSHLVLEFNAITAKISDLIGRPALLGNVGEFIASELFDFALETRGNNHAWDGRFRSGPLKDKTANIKVLGRREGILDLNMSLLPDYYLVLAGPRARTSMSGLSSRPWSIASIHLFNARELHSAFTLAGRRVGIASSVRLAEWDAAEVYPHNRSGILKLTDEQRRWIETYGKAPVDAGDTTLP